jgi:hypothetical protein
MSTTQELKEVVKKCYGFLKKLNFLEYLVVTIFIGNQYTAYYFPYDGGLVIKNQKFWNPLTNNWDQSKDKLRIPNQLEFIENELIPPGYEIFRIFFILKYTTIITEKQNIFYDVYTDNQLFYGCKEQDIKRKLKLVYEIKKIEDQIETMKVLIKLRDEIKEFVEMNNKIKDQITEVKNQKFNTNKMTMALESFIKNNPVVIKTKPKRVRKAKPQEPLPPPRRSPRNSPGKEIGYYSKMAFGNIHPSLQELLSDQNWHTCVAEFKLILELDYILRKKTAELNELKSKYPSIVINTENYRALSEMLEKMESSTQDSSRELNDLLYEQQYFQLKLDQSAKNLVKAKYSFGKTKQTKIKILLSDLNKLLI